MTSESPAAGPVTLKIPRPLYERLRRRISHSDFHSVTELAVYLLRDIANGKSLPGTEESLGGSVDHDAPPPLSAEELRLLRAYLGSRAGVTGNQSGSAP
jgi:hypothetical protein